jgi:hypothetical protein
MRGSSGSLNPENFSPYFDNDATVAPLLRL